MLQGQLELFGFGYYLYAVDARNQGKSKYKLVICPKLCLFLVSELEVTIKTILTNVYCEKEVTKRSKYFVISN